MTSVGFEPAIPAMEQQQTYALERTATEIGDVYISLPKFCVCLLYPYAKEFL
jgi:hypothetical protein